MMVWFLVALIILIGFHECGHFLVARWCGVKVLRFSLGFGKVLASWHDKKGTEYAVSLIPLGGYVKMLDETADEVSAEDRPFAFNTQSVWKRIAIVAAGPLFNLLLAAICFWLVFMIGVKSLAPIIETVKPHSLAEMVGFTTKEKITQVGDWPVRNWHDFNYALMREIGTKNILPVRVKSIDTGAIKTVYLPMVNWSFEKKDLIENLGLVPFIPTIPSMVGKVEPGSPADRAGIQANDKIVQVDNKPLKNWLELVNYIKDHPGYVTTMVILRENQLKTLSISIGGTQGQGFLGMSSKPVEWPKEWFHENKNPPFVALKQAVTQTADLTATTFSLFGQLVMGHLSFKTISGPVGIAKMADVSAQGGFVYYLSFLGAISVSLGVLNLLPIPLLDGGHLLYCFLEIVRRKPLSLKVQSFGLYLGLILLAGILCLSLFNDIYAVLAD